MATKPDSAQALLPDKGGALLVHDGVPEPPEAPLAMPVQQITRRAPHVAAPPPLPVVDQVALRAERALAVAARQVGLGISLAAAVMAAAVFTRLAAIDGLSVLDTLRAVLIFVTTGWIAWGASLVIVGLFAPDAPVRTQGGDMKRRTATQDGHAAMFRGPVCPDRPIASRTVVLVPVRNEDPMAVMSRIVAMDLSLRATGQGEMFDFAILSDTSDAELLAQEQRWLARAISAEGLSGRLFYRHRPENTGRKPGNIAQYLRRSGGAHPFAVVLDADSLMEGATLVEMVRRMEAQPDLGLLQTVPVVIGARTLFGRAMQFAAAMNTRVYARGMAAMQGRAGVYWGHNAIFRTRAFAACCGLPDLPGCAPFGGPILSHDHVEAALMRRAGWTVRLDADLDGSYETAPDTAFDHASRDRRWCQGNLQHLRVIAAADLDRWSRFNLGLGIFSYVVPLVWIGFLVASMIAPMPPTAMEIRFDAHSPVPVFVPASPPGGFGLLIGIFGLLLFPRLLIALFAMASGRTAGFGGNLRTLASVCAEIVFSTLMAPLMLAWQTRAVLGVLAGRDGGWQVQSRHRRQMSIASATCGSLWMVVPGAVVMLVAAVAAPAILPWLFLIALPLVIAPVLISFTSSQVGDGLFVAPSELAPSPVILLEQEVAARWRDFPPIITDAVPDTLQAQAQSQAGPLISLQA